MITFLKKVRITNSLFLIGTFATTCTALPLYIWHFGLDTFQVVLFIFFFISTAMSITLGYHRLYSHLTFEASSIIKAYTLFFGAAAFEGSALVWAADHRRHHKHVDQEEDPYGITQGVFHAHIGWLLFRRTLTTPLTWVRDLQKDRLAMLQHRYYVPIAIVAGIVLPAIAGGLWGGWSGALGGFLFGGIARIVAVHHVTFCINSLCHLVGERPYSSRCSARDSLLMALVTFGEGYHNYHHEFQNDYRNGVRGWQFDPTKWVIWSLHKLNLVKKLRRVSPEKIFKAKIAESDMLLETTLKNAPKLAEGRLGVITHKRQEVEQAFSAWEVKMKGLRAFVTGSNGSAKVEEKEAKRDAGRAWREFCRAMKLWHASIEESGLKIR